MPSLPVFPGRKVDLEDPREFTHAWAQQAVLDLWNFAEFLNNHAGDPNLQPHEKSDLCRRIADMHKRLEILRTEKDRFDLAYFTTGKRSVRVFGKPYANYHVAVQNKLFDTVRNVLYDALSKRLASEATEQDVNRIDAAYVKGIAKDFWAELNLASETAEAELECLQADLGTEVGRCNVRDRQSARPSSDPGRTADSKTDRTKKSLPKSYEVIRLANKLKTELPKGRKKKDIAMDFTDGDERKANTLLRQLRGDRHGHLLG